MNSSALEPRLIDALQPIRAHVVATCIYHLFKSGLYDSIYEQGPISARELAQTHGFEPERLVALLLFLSNEGLLERREPGFALSDQGRALRDFRGWYTMLIGGYGETFLQLGDKLGLGAGPAERNAGLVGEGSCAISHYDAIPLTRSLMQEMPGRGRRMLDLGCGNAAYLVEFCKAYPDTMAIGVEPSADGCRYAEELVAQHGLSDRITIVNDDAQGLLKRTLPFEPDLLVFGFVLHEVLGQSGPAGVLELLSFVARRFAGSHVAVIEVDGRMDDPGVFEHGLGLAYYNAYFLLHPFTAQRLARASYWEEMFERAGFDVVAKQTVDHDVDSTDLELGYLLAPRAR